KIELLPVSISTLIKLLQSSEKVHVITVVSTIKEREIYLKKAHKILSYLIKVQAIYHYQASSFSTLTQHEAFHRGIKNYFFIPLPVRLEVFCATITKYYFMRIDNQFKWPGGKNPRSLIVKA